MTEHGLWGRYGSLGSRAAVVARHRKFVTRLPNAYCPGQGQCANRRELQSPACAGIGTVQDSLAFAPLLTFRVLLTSSIAQERTGSGCSCGGSMEPLSRQMNEAIQRQSREDKHCKRAL